MSKAQLTFVFFILYQLSEALNIPVPQVFSRLVRTGVLDDYVIPHYDTLHTLGQEYLVEDISDFVKEREAAGR